MKTLKNNLFSIALLATISTLIVSSISVFADEKNATNSLVANDEYYYNTFLKNNIKLVNNCTDSNKSISVTSPIKNNISPIRNANNDLLWFTSTQTNVLSPVDGTIKCIGSSDTFGNYIIIKTNDDYQYTLFHLDNINVNVDDEVKINDNLALTGNSGKVTSAIGVSIPKASIYKVGLSIEKEDIEEQLEVEIELKSFDNKTKEDYVSNMINNLSNIDFIEIEKLHDLNATLPTSTNNIKIQSKNTIEFITEKEQNVLSPIGGTVAEIVSYAEKDRETVVPTMGFGSIVIIEDENENKFMLSHLGSVACEKGDKLKVGDIVGTTGTTGRALNSMVGLSLISKDKKTVNINFINNLS